MSKIALPALVAVASLTLVALPVDASASAGRTSAGTGPTHTLSVTGTGVGMYPAYAASVRRYAATTTEATYPGDDVDNTQNTGASITVTASTSDPNGTVLVDGRPLSGAQTTLTGLDAGDEVSVIYVDAGGREADSVFVLPADFPTMTATIKKPGITPGLVGLTLVQFYNPPPPAQPIPLFDTVVDENGVPAWVRTSRAGAMDLKLQPNGHYSESRGPAADGQGIGSTQVVEMNDRFQPIASYHTEGGLTNTDSHDSILEPDGSRVLIAYEPNAGTGNTDAVIQEVNPAGEVTFQWDSSALVGETVNDPSKPDYAHINSVEIVDGGQNFLASFRHLSAVIKIARVAHDGYQPGDIVWKLGGRDSTFSFVDDPYDGPCAQHTASQLPNGDVMVFDDGSASGFGKFCVDQSNPTGPTHERTQSRMTVYHLDQGADTATLVRSYAPTNWFTYFMGSAQYLGEATGNILIGWAADRDALATEVGPDDKPVWQLKAAESEPGHSYFSYRSVKFAVPDTTPPVVDVPSPSEGATFDHQQQATSDFGCTDQGGSSLQTCGDQVSGSPIDTSTPGPHTYVVRATDSAGNTTTVTRHYTVGAAPTPPPTTPPPAARYRPDARIQRSNGSWAGIHVFDSSTHQTVSRAFGAHQHHVRVRVALWNDGNRSDRCLVHATAGNRKFLVNYRYGGHDVTRAVKRGTWRTPSIAPGARRELQERITATKQAAAGSHRTFVIRCGSVGKPSAHDAVGVRIRVR